MTQGAITRERAIKRYRAIRLLGLPSGQAQRARASIGGFLKVLAEHNIDPAPYGDLCIRMNGWPKGKPNPRVRTNFETQRRLRDINERQRVMLKLAFELLDEWCHEALITSWHYAGGLMDRTELLMKTSGYTKYQVINGDDMEPRPEDHSGVAPMHTTHQDEALANYCNQPHDFETEETRDDLNNSDEFEVTP